MTSVPAWIMHLLSFFILFVIFYATFHGETGPLGIVGDTFVHVFRWSRKHNAAILVTPLLESKQKLSRRYS